MAATDPNRIRTTISVDREVHQVFVQMAEASGMSVSRCMGEWLADTAEGAQFVAIKMQEARAAPMSVMREMQAHIAGMSSDVDETVKALRAGTMKRLKQNAPPALPHGRSGSGSAAGRTAPSSLTGLKSPQKGKK